MSLRRRRQLVSLACHLASALLWSVWLGLGEAAQGLERASALALLGVLLYALFGRLNPLPGRVACWAIRAAQCSACGAIVDLVDTWRCRCGFVTWRPRHVFAPCPHCGQGFRWVVCPGCGASILI